AAAVQGGVQEPAGAGGGDPAQHPGDKGDERDYADVVWAERAQQNGGEPPGEAVCDERRSDDHPGAGGGAPGGQADRDGEPAAGGRGRRRDQLRRDPGERAAAARGAAAADGAAPVGDCARVRAGAGGGAGGPGDAGRGARRELARQGGAAEGDPHGDRVEAVRAGGRAGQPGVAGSGDGDAGARPHAVQRRQRAGGQGDGRRPGAEPRGARNGVPAVAGDGMPQGRVCQGGGVLVPGGYGADRDQGHGAAAQRERDARLHQGRG
ncbi:hypothetical protein IWQ56_006539, partial [Coemansia nantahalensis]